MHATGSARTECLTRVRTVELAGYPWAGDGRDRVGLEQDIGCRVMRASRHPTGHRSCRTAHQHSASQHANGNTTGVPRSDCFYYDCLDQTKTGAQTSGSHITRTLRLQRRVDALPGSLAGSSRHSRHAWTGGMSLLLVIVGVLLVAAGAGVDAESEIQPAVSRQQEAADRPPRYTATDPEDPCKAGKFTYCYFTLVGMVTAFSLFILCVVYMVIWQACRIQTRFLRLISPSGAASGSL